MCTFLRSSTLLAGAHRDGMHRTPRRSRSQRLAAGTLAVAACRFAVRQRQVVSFVLESPLPRAPRTATALTSQVSTALRPSRVKSSLSRSKQQPGHRASVADAGGAAIASSTSTSLLKGAVALCGALAAPRVVGVSSATPGAAGSPSRCAGQATSGNSEVNVNAEIEALQREAQQLREAAAELEAAREEERAEESKRLFKKFDADGSGTVDVEEVIRGLREFDGTEVDMERAHKILEACDINKNGVLELEEFDILKLKGALADLEAAERAAEQARQREERKRKEIERKERKEEEFKRREAAVVDTSLPVRLASILAYALPLVDCIRDVRASSWISPELLPFVQPLITLGGLEQLLPFGGLIVFIVMQVLAANQGLPRLLRYNLRQAIVLDIMLILANFVIFILPPQDQITAEAVILAMVAVVFGYISVMNLLGLMPRGIPALSKFTESSAVGEALVSGPEEARIEDLTQRDAKRKGTHAEDEKK